jgi:hypothetical protein
MIQSFKLQILFITQLASRVKILITFRERVAKSREYNTLLINVIVVIK